MEEIGLFEAAIVSGSFLLAGAIAKIASLVRNILRQMDFEDSSTN